ncbi:MAG: hypothetical protein QXX30_03755 [Candidatus Aenigmatarchaeota archaeon]
MGLRSFLRDLLILYGCIIIFQEMAKGNIKFDISFVIIFSLIFFLTIWFLLEKIGIVQKLI